MHYFLTWSTPSDYIYKTRTQFKINLDQQFLLINYELYIIKIISLKIIFEYEFNDIFFMIYILFLVGKNC
jgi:hypothetical protein